MITITTSNGRKGSGATVASASHALVGGPQELYVKLGRGIFIPVEQASADDVRRSGMLWASKDRSRHVVALVSEVTERTASTA